ncbi:MAG: hypothetical protein IJD97_03630 [Clostridia bacterium]|nr:hypothetical protein [Clostridia bacterium]
MKKSSFIALIMGTVSGCMFALGMCMALLPEWNAFVPGIILGAAGIILGLVTVLVWRKKENKAPIKIGEKTVGAILISVFGALLLGVGMCFCLVWNNIILGTVIGMFGIITLLFLIPFIKGLK